MAHIPPNVHKPLQRGIVVPAHPLALTAERLLDEQFQRALTRYYIAAGAGGVAVGVHTTQFAIRDPKVGLFEPMLDLARDELDRLDEGRDEPIVRIGGVCGDTKQAAQEAALLADRGFHAGLLSLAAMRGAPIDALIEHCAQVAEVIPLFGFYLQPAVGGRVLPYEFWRRFCEIENVVAIKIAPFNRYQTIDVVRAVVDAGRDDIALYTGNDDNIVGDLLTRFQFTVNGEMVERRIVGGLLGHWAVWTRTAVDLLERCRIATAEDVPKLLTAGIEVTDMNAAIFDAANGFAGCIPGIHYVLHRQGLLEVPRTLDSDEMLSEGQAAEIERVRTAYPRWLDDDFVAEHRGEWLA